MEEKPLHYDGSVQNVQSVNEEVNESVKITDEMRANISGNPFTFEQSK
ncbi:hypothetical protein WMO40_16535 [Bacillaceae bacterium CLA-AA-H227]|uniref:Uncharacterized protein n=1 Tax=Robertmurraya yapensis (ex Hitch et al 2024) TaxID=3133160 RepID=A0ACC6SEA6_9BACI|nr:hypothetical protein [Bacillus yapensis]